MPCKYLDITVKEYHDYPALSSGGLRCLMKNGPATFHARYIEKNVIESQTDAQRLGSVTHLAFEHADDPLSVLEIIPTVIEEHSCVADINDAMPEKTTAKKLVVGDKINRQIKSHKEYMVLRESTAASNGRMWITDVEAEMIVGQMRAILDNPATREVVEQGGGREIPACNTDPQTRILIKALADIEQPDRIIDLKTTRQLTTEQFARDAKKHGYHLQMDHYTRCFEKPEPAQIISVTNVEPYTAFLFEFTKEMRDDAHEIVGNLYAEISGRQGKEDKESWLPKGFGEVNLIGIEGNIEDPDLVDWRVPHE